MRVLICLGRLYMGGIEKYAIDLALGLNDKGYTVRILVFFRVMNEEKRILLQKQGIEITELKCTSGRDLKLPLRFLKIIWKTKPDIIHFNILPMLAVIPLMFVNTKTVYTIHQMVLNSTISRIYKNYLNGIIAVSNAVVHLNSRNLNYFSKSDWQVIYHGVNLSDHRVEYSKKDVVNLIMVCRLAQDKHPDQAVEIISYLKNNSNISYKLTLVGAGDVDDTIYLDKIKTDIMKNKLNDVVEFVGWQEDVYGYIADSHGMLILSESESFGYSGIESLAHGVPIFSYNVDGGLHEFHVKDRTGIVIDKRNPIALAKEIDAVFKQPSKWNELSNNAFEKSKDFTIQQMVDKTESFYFQLIHRN